MQKKIDLLFSKKAEMMALCYKWVWATCRTRQGVTKLLVWHKLSLLQPTDAVSPKTIQASHVAGFARKYKYWIAEIYIVFFIIE